MLLLNICLWYLIPLIIIHMIMYILCTYVAPTSNLTLKEIYNVWGMNDSKVLIIWLPFINILTAIGFIIGTILVLVLENKK